MRVLSVHLGFLVMSLAIGTEPDDRVKKHFKSDNYTVTWGTAPTYEADAELEIGDGGGHGGRLRWLRLMPRKDGVDVLSIQFDGGRQPYESTWPPDHAAVVVKSGRLKLDAYAAILRDLAVVDSAKLKPIERNEVSMSTQNFWVYASLTTTKKTLIDFNWAGYYGSRTELDFAKPQAAVHLVAEAIKELDMKDYTLTDDERAWAVAKFSRDWKKFKGQEFHWWVRERYIQMIGVIGDKAAFPVLKEILSTDAPKGKPRDASDARCVYYAINAVTRLTKKDVRDKPVEEMDIEKMRQKALDLMKDTK